MFFQVIYSLPILQLESFPYPDKVIAQVLARIEYDFGRTPTAFRDRLLAKAAGEPVPDLDYSLRIHHDSFSDSLMFLATAN
jgi:hypothetical protein